MTDSTLNEKTWPAQGPISLAELMILREAEAQQSQRFTNFEWQYAASLANLINYGAPSGDRTGTGTLRRQGQHFTLDVSDYKLPALRGKKVHVDKILVEALWMFTGDTNIRFLNERGVNYWNDWATPTGDLGPIYGHQMRNFAGVDQLTSIIDQIRSDPDSRRIVMSLWNPADLPQMRLPPCHLMYQICVHSPVGCGPGPVMDMHVTQRSGDAFLGVPYDFVLFTAFFRIISQAVGLRMNAIHYTVADYHMYSNHEDQVREYLETVCADPKRLVTAPAPTLSVRSPIGGGEWGVDEWVAWLLEDDMKNFQVGGYEPYGRIPAKIAV